MLTNTMIFGMPIDFTGINNEVEVKYGEDSCKLEFWYYRDAYDFTFSEPEPRGWKVQDILEAHKRGCWMLFKKDEKFLEIDYQRFFGDSNSFPVRGLNLFDPLELRIQQAFAEMNTWNQQEDYPVIDIHDCGDTKVATVDEGNEKYLLEYFVGYLGEKPDKLVISRKGIISREEFETLKQARLEEAAMIARIQAGVHTKVQAEKEAEKSEIAKEVVEKVPFWKKMFNRNVN